MACPRQQTFCQALRSDFNANHWRGISKRKMYQMGAEKGGLMATLRLSHEQLPRDLKECFVSCSLFPKGHAFRKEEIIRVWMALGYLDGPGAGVQRMEDTGNSIFTQLLQRSFFKENNEAPGTYIIPEPFDELAEFLSSGEYFRIKKRSEFDDGPINIPERARHVYLDINDLARASGRLSRITNLRSLVVVGQISSGSQKSDLIQTLKELLIGMKCLRVLMVSEPLLADLPKLKHLRYLEIHVEENYGNASLPESICKLYQLQTLIRRFCGNKLSMPKNFKQLISLQFLETEPEAVCTIADIGKLTSLKVLHLRQMRSLRRIGEEIYGQDIPSGFPQLHELLFEGLRNLEEWFLPNRDIQLLPKLRSLSITNCGKLKGPQALPYLLENLPSVFIKNCPNIGKDYIRPSMTIGKPILKKDVECIRTSPVYCQKPASLKRKFADRSW
uniref:Uncharacterized protein n=1 Tax=Aegilops tauschii subsp. strangulata TaxID=200361 RepID=A0A453HNQ5_AEGTS